MKHKSKTFFGFLSDDNWVHWPSLLAGLSFTLQDQLKHDNTRLVIGETRYGAIQDGLFSREDNMMNAGAGVFFNSKVANLVLNGQMSKPASTDWIALVNSDIRRVAMMNDIPLINADYLLSQPPCFYVMKLSSTGCGPSSWARSPPAVFNRLTAQEGKYMQSLAGTAAIRGKGMGLGAAQPSAIVLPSFNAPIRGDSMCSSFDKHLPQPAAACNEWNCGSTLACTSSLLVESWAGIHAHQWYVPQYLPRLKLVAGAT